MKAICDAVSATGIWQNALKELMLAYTDCDDVGSLAIIDMVDKGKVRELSYISAFQFVRLQVSHTVIVVDMLSSLFLNLLAHK